MFPPFGLAGEVLPPFGIGAAPPGVGAKVSEADLTAEGYIGTGTMIDRHKEGYQKR